MKKAIILLKKRLYFAVAWYFSIFSRIILKRWSPRVIVVTGSNGKTTMLNMLEAQLGDMATYTHHANSPTGISLYLLGLNGVEGSRWRWAYLLAAAPFKAFRQVSKTAWLVAEADSDRPGEANFLGKLLKPEITVWVNSARTHSMNFTHLVDSGEFSTLEGAIADEFSNYAKHTTKLVIADGDNKFIVDSLKDLHIEKKLIKIDQSIDKYTVSASGTKFKLKNGDSYSFTQPLAKEVGYQVIFADEIRRLLKSEPDYDYTRMHFPPGRSRVFKSKSGALIFDSTYNANLNSMETSLGVFRKLSSKPQILVLGDMLEQGSNEANEHRLLGQYVAREFSDAKLVILVGPRVGKYAAPILEEFFDKNVLNLVDGPLDALDILRSKISSDDQIFLKGGRFLEGVVEKMLKNPADAQYLCRREAIWNERRSGWGV